MRTLSPHGHSQLTPIEGGQVRRGTHSIAPSGTFRAHPLREARQSSRRFWPVSFWMAPMRCVTSSVPR
jgi:hypothetical protein